ncbi:hypothetical protein PF008_g9180 [Phytophthora fragariae]|uniref:Uncharacterized protein n=1 Tax=Phytophthora fragariae TaxID=53985 RepID=A0A6G0RYY6_9STRA|nr:hypothetical protein PF008_g9180 [Phytophthora fragariae]
MALRRKHGHAAFVLMLYVYVSRPRAQRLRSLRRETDSRIQEQLPRIAAYIREHSIVGGAASERYAAVSQARLSVDAPVQVPGNATMRQLRFIDEEERAMDHDQVEHQSRCDGEYHLVRVRMHGTPVPMYLNVSDLREALGLPHYS